MATCIFGKAIPKITFFYQREHYRDIYRLSYKINQVRTVMYTEYLESKTHNQELS